MEDRFRIKIVHFIHQQRVFIGKIKSKEKSRRQINLHCRISMKNYCIKIPTTVQLKLNGNKCLLNGPLGQEQIILPKKCNLNFKFGQNQLEISEPSLISKENRQANQTVIGLIQQGIRGVLTGYRKQLELIGIGYRAKIVDRTLELKLGFSHLIFKNVSPFLKLTCPKPNIVVIQGTNLQKINEFAAILQRLRLPEPYKGKGIFYKNQSILRKQGKKS